jgi:hypothetical protein
MYPATIGHSVTKHLMCQLVRCGTPIWMRKPAPHPARRSHLRCGKVARGTPLPPPRPVKIRLIAQQFAAVLILSIKAAPSTRNIDPESQGIPQPWPPLKR